MRMGILLVFLSAFSGVSISADSELCSAEGTSKFRPNPLSPTTELSLLELNLLQFTGTIDGKNGRRALIKLPYDTTIFGQVGDPIGIYHGEIQAIRDDVVVIIENATRCKLYGEEQCVSAPRCRELRIGIGPTAEHLEAYKRRKARSAEERIVCCE